VNQKFKFLNDEYGFAQIKKIGPINQGYCSIEYSTANVSCLVFMDSGNIYMNFRSLFETSSAQYDAGDLFDYFEHPDRLRITSQLYVDALEERQKESETSYIERQAHLIASRLKQNMKRIVEFFNPSVFESEKDELKEYLKKQLDYYWKF
jgi:hypothetical protein